MRYRHALVLNPYVKESSAAMGFFPPTGLEYVATAMKGLAGKVSLVDLRQEPGLHNPDALALFIASEGVDLVCVSCNWSYYFPEVIALINRIPPWADIIVGGQQATDYVNELFERCPGIRIIVRGEGEVPMQEILKGRPLSGILNISYRDDGAVVHNPSGEPAPIDELCFPDRSLRRTSYYLKNKDVVLSRSGFDTVLSALGCPFSCRFCTFNLNPLGQKRQYSTRSPASIIEELKTIDAKVIFMADDNFFVNPKRVMEICDLIVKEGIDKRFVAHARLEIYRHPEMLKKAWRAGFRVMLMGIESPHDKILKLFNKGFTQKDIIRAFEVLRGHPFYYHGYFIFGNIGETEEEMLYIPEFAVKIGLDSISAQKLRLEKFSAMIEIVEKTPGYHYNPTGFVYSDEYDVDRLGRIGKTIKKRFYTPGRLVKIVRKLGTTGIITKADLLNLLLKTPQLITRIAAREVDKKAGRLRKRLKRLIPAPAASPAPSGLDKKF